jgi:hypothetical protein
LTKLAYIRLDDVPFLPIPDLHRPFVGPGGVTGGGWMAGVSPLRGLYQLEDAEGPIDLAGVVGMGAGGGAGEQRGGPDTGEGAEAGLEAFPWRAPGDGSPAWIGAGSWGRALAGGGEERGALLDGLPVVVVQQLKPSADLPVTHLLLGAHLSPGAVRSVTLGLLPRITGRQRRGATSHAGEPHFGVTGWPAAVRVTEAREVLVELPLDPPEPETAAAGGLVGVDGKGALHRLSDAAAHDVALGALMAGEVTLAEQLLAPVLTHPSAGATGQFGEAAGDAHLAAGKLLVAVAWATWTGRVERLRPLGPSLFAWVDALEEGAGVPLPSAFPSLDRLLTQLADALEPLGDRDAGAFLRGRAEAHAPRAAHPDRASGGAGGAGRGGGRQLPVLSASGAASGAGTGAVSELPLPPRLPEAQLPPVEAFASPYHPSVQHRAGVHAARIIRSAVEGLLGVIPDAAWGRLRLAPDLTQLAPGDDGERTLSVEGLRIADARVRLTCRSHATGCTLAVAQVGGRVPLNLIFEPRLPLARVDRVEMGGEAVQVQILEEGPGIRLRLQFPLDPARSITVHGTSR